MRSNYKLTANELVRMLTSRLFNQDAADPVKGCKLCDDVEGNMVCASCTQAMLAATPKQKGLLVSAIRKAGGAKLAEFMQRTFICHANPAKSEADKKKGKRLDAETKQRVIDHLQAGWSYSRVAEKFDLSVSTAHGLMKKAQEVQHAVR